MRPSTLITAIATTNSSDDKFGRVKIKVDNYLKGEIGPVMVVHPLTVAKDDRVWIDISSGVENPVVTGKVHEDNDEVDIELYNSTNGTDWSKAVVKDNKFSFQNSDSTKVEVEGKKVTVETGGGASVEVDDNGNVTIENGSSCKIEMNGTKVTINGHLEVS